MKSDKQKLQEIYVDSLKKHYKATQQMRERYQSCLLEIENTRYEMRMTVTLNRENQEISRHVAKHQELLEQVENVLIGLLNCIGCSVDLSRSDGSAENLDFNPSEPFFSQANRIYQILSIDTVKDFFDTKKGDTLC